MEFLATSSQPASSFAELSLFPPVLNPGIPFGIFRPMNASFSTTTTLTNYKDNSTATTATNTGSSSSNSSSPTSSSPDRWGCGTHGCYLNRRMEACKKQLDDSEARMASLIEQSNALPSNLEADCRDAMSEAEGRYLGVAAYAKKCNVREAVCCLLAMLTRQKKQHSNKELRLRKHVASLKETFEEVGAQCRESAMQVGVVLDEARRLMKEFEAPWRLICEAKKGLDDICPGNFGCSLADKARISEDNKKRAMGRKLVGRMHVRAEVFRSRNSDLVQKLRERAMGMYLMEGKCLRIAQSLRRTADEPDLKRMARELKAWADEMKQEMKDERKDERKDRREEERKE